MNMGGPMAEQVRAEVLPSDQTATGAIIDWFVIGGYNGFVVDATDFPYVDGSSVDPGVAQSTGELNPFGTSPTPPRR
jgi:hypothetical protein